MTQGATIDSREILKVAEEKMDQARRDFCQSNLASRDTHKGLIEELKRATIRFPGSSGETASKPTIISGGVPLCSVLLDLDVRRTVMGDISEKIARSF